MNHYVIVKFAILMTALIPLSGCAVFGQAAEKIADGVEVYCEQPYVYRSQFRNTVNAQLGGTGHTVHVHCAGDPADASLTGYNDVRKGERERSSTVGDRSHDSTAARVSRSRNEQSHREINGTLSRLYGLTGNLRKEATTKTQYEELLCLDQDTQLTPVSPLPLPLPLSQPLPEPLLSSAMVLPIWMYSAPQPSQILPLSKQSWLHYEQNSVSRLEA